MIELHQLLGYGNAPFQTKRLPDKPRHVFGLDPGPVSTGYCLMDFASKGVHELGRMHNGKVYHALHWLDPDQDIVAIERMHFQNQKPGKDTFEACEMVGDFRRAALSLGFFTMLVSRRTSRTFVAKSISADDGDVKREILKRYRLDALKTVNHELPEDDKKTRPTSHAFSAVAVVLTLIERELKR